jgi:hypothetical protein
MTQERRKKKKKVQQEVVKLTRQRCLGRREEQGKGGAPKLREGDIENDDILEWAERLDLGGSRDHRAVEHDLVAHEDERWPVEAELLSSQSVLQKFAILNRWLDVSLPRLNASSPMNA